MSVDEQGLLLGVVAELPEDDRGKLELRSVRPDENKVKTYGLVKRWVQINEVNETSLKSLLIKNTIFT